jgi:hypothetical protein
VDDRSHNDIRRFLGEVAAPTGCAPTYRSDGAGFQTTGQILNGIRTLIGEVESVLGEDLRRGDQAPTRADAGMLHGLLFPVSAPARSPTRVMSTT